MTARRSLIAMREDKDFEYEFASGRLLTRRTFLCNCPDAVRFAFSTHNDSFERKSPQQRHALAPLIGDGLLISDGATFLLNAPPHHLIWWTDASLRAVAAQAGLEVERIVPTPWCDISSKVYWISRFSAIKTGERFFWHSWPLHVSSAIAAGLGLMASKIAGPPRNAEDEGAGLLMFARKLG